MTILKHLGILSHKGLLLQKGILYANGLLPPDVGFGSYYQWVFTGNSSEIIQKGSNWYIRNFGVGGSVVDIEVFSQVLTSDGSLVITFDDLTGRSIIDSKGTSTPTINGNTVEISIGQQFEFTFDTGEIFYLKESKGLEVWGTKQTKGVLSTETGVWDNLSSEAFPALYALGGELYISDTVPTDKIRIIKSDTGFITPTITGYTKDSEYEPYIGVWDNGSEYLNADDAGLNALYGVYSQLNGLANPSRFTFDDLDGIKLGDQKEKFQTLFSNIEAIGKDYGFETSTDITEPDYSSYDGIQILLKGQSNAGSIENADMNDIPTELQPYIPNVFIKRLANASWINIDDDTDPAITAVYLGLQLAKETGKNIYIALTSIGSTGYYSTPSWLVADLQYCKDTLDNYNAGFALLTNVAHGGIVTNMGEYDSTLQVDADRFEQNFADEMNYYISGIGNVPIVSFQLNWKSASVVSNYGNTVNQARKNILENKNNANYIPNGINQYVNEYLMRVDETHFPTDAYKGMYRDTARLLLKQSIDNQRVNIVNNKSMKLTSRLTMPLSVQPSIGAKSIWVKWDKQPITGNQYIFNSYNTNTITILIKDNDTQAFFINQSTLILGLATFSLSGNGAAVAGFRWDGTTDTNSAEVFNALLDGSSVNIRQGTVSELEVNPATIQPTNDFFHNEQYGLFIVDGRKITDDELLLIEANRDTEIEGVRYYSLDEGLGDKVYSNLREEATSSSISWSNNSEVPFINIVPDRELQENTGNYRVVPIGTIEGGWNKVENIDLNKWYDVLGSSIKLPQIPELVAIDTANIFYDNDGIAKYVDGSTLRGVIEVYITVISDNFGIKSIKLNDIIIPASDFRLTKSEDGKYITDMASQPYKEMINLDGKMTNSEGQMYNLKTI
jgi:hypothetical protein